MRAIALLAVLAAGCGGDDEGAAAADPCVPGCEDTMAAACDAGPSSQEVCESDCEALLEGPCAEAYDTLLSCDGTVECDAQGYPVVAGCEAEQQAFVTCLNAT